jgi:XTP/dITP diphosphohydrolase
VCAIALAEGGQIARCVARRGGRTILDEARGKGGFGYDPLFYCPQVGCTFGEATEEQKFAVSHRGQALRKMLEAIR